MEYVAKYMILTTDSKVEGGETAECGNRNRSLSRRNQPFWLGTKTFADGMAYIDTGALYMYLPAMPLCRHHIGIPTCSWYAQALCNYANCFLLQYYTYM